VRAAGHDAHPRSAATLWREFVHHFVHPTSAAIVLVAAGIEVLEWLETGVEHLARLVDLTPGPAGG